jgi:hypothetical protein
MRMRKLEKKPARPRQSARLKTLAQFAHSLSARSIALAAVGVTGAAVLFAAVTSDVQPDRPVVRAIAKNSAPPPLLPALPSEAPPAAAVPPAASERPQAPAPITITGCLERNADTFRLKDTAGDGAPKARSWKSGFLKKGSAPIEIVDAANRVKLPNHVGQRVSVTGTLVDREMQVRSLQRVAASCSIKS